MVRLVSSVIMAAALVLPATSMAFVHSARMGCARMTTTRAFGSTVTRLRLSMISTETRGQPDTESFRIIFKKDGKEISPWHDVPLKASNDGSTFNFISEIPKYGTAKMEVSTKEQLNPIAQDIKKGKLRFYHGPIFWNYGMLPQTWEDPNVSHHELKVKGDNDPVDVVEIGSKALPMGSITAVKPLGVLAMIDDGELDWKVIAISASDPMFDELNDIADVEAKLPGYISGIREWFRWYKTPDDKPLNGFGFNEKALDKAHALKVIEETHGFWKDLQSGKTAQGKLWKA